MIFTTKISLLLSTTAILLFSSTKTHAQNIENKTAEVEVCMTGNCDINADNPLGMLLPPQLAKSNLSESEIVSNATSEMADFDKNLEVIHELETTSDDESVQVAQEVGKTSDDENVEVAQEVEETSEDENAQVVREVETKSNEENVEVAQKLEKTSDGENAEVVPELEKASDNSGDENVESVDELEPQAQEQLPTPRGISREAAARLRYGKDDILLGEIEKQQGGKFGKVLDAGTSLVSLRWIATLGEHGMTSYSAVASSHSTYEKVKKEAEELAITDMGEIILGRWFDEHNPLELDEKYDTILVDYLIGALDAYSPYKQDAILSKLASYLNPGGRMYIVGLEPIPDYVSQDSKLTNSIPGANMICHLRQMRDAAILLGGERPFREYPLEWIIRQFQGIDSMKLLKAKQFGNLWDQKMFSNQIKNGITRLQYVPSQNLASEMSKALHHLEMEFSQVLGELGEGQTVKFGFDYLVTAEKK